MSVFPAGNNAYTDRTEEFVGELSGTCSKMYGHGWWRCVEPEETISKIAPFFGALGITRVGDITGLDRIGIPVIAVCRPNSRSLSVYQGKGATTLAAKASGLMESLERYHAEVPPPPDWIGSFQSVGELRGVVSVQAFSARKGATFMPDLERGWIQGVDLLNQLAPVWLPHEVVHYSTAGPFPRDKYLQTSSTGLASGNTYFEAILHGLCETVERDCSTLWRLRIPALRGLGRIRIDSIDDPICVDLIQRITRAKLLVGVWESSNDLGIASFVCRIAEPDNASLVPYEFSDGAGCHPASSVALARAITEAAQSRATTISGARDDLFDRFFAPPSRELSTRLRQELVDGPCPRLFKQSPNFEGKTIEEDISHVLGRLSAAKVTLAAVVCLAKKEIGIPVVRVLIPELEDGELTAAYSPRRRALRAYRGF